MSSIYHHLIAQAIVYWLFKSRGDLKSLFKQMSTRMVEFIPVRCHRETSLNKFTYSVLANLNLRADFISRASTRIDTLNINTHDPN